MPMKSAPKISTRKSRYRFLSRLTCSLVPNCSGTRFLVRIFGDDFRYTRVMDIIRPRKAGSRADGGRTDGEISRPWVAAAEHLLRSCSWHRNQQPYGRLQQSSAAMTHHRCFLVLSYQPAGDMLPTVRLRLRWRHSRCTNRRVRSKQWINKRYHMSHSSKCDVANSLQCWLVRVYWCNGPFTHTLRFY